MEIQKTIYIPLKPHLVDYYGGLSTNNSCMSFVGCVINGFISKTPPNYIFKKPTGTYLELNLVNMAQYGVDVRGCVYISPFNELNIRRILDKHFNALFISYMDDKKRYEIIIDKKVRKAEISTLIMNFCIDNKMEFTPTILDLLKKKYYRHTKKIHKTDPKVSFGIFL